MRGLKKKKDKSWIILILMKNCYRFWFFNLLIDSKYTFESIWTNYNQDGNTEELFLILMLESETVLSATYEE